MNLKSRLRQCLAKTRSVVVLRRDLVHLAQPSQLSVALLDLQHEGVVERLGEGIYSITARKGGDTKVWIQRVATEALQKLGLGVDCCTVKNQEIVVRLKNSTRSLRSLTIEGRPVRPVMGSYDYFALPEDVEALPKKRVAHFVRNLARAHRVTYTASGLDVWANAVTRAAGDEVRSDRTSQLLVGLKQHQAVNARQFSKLLINHRRERAHV